MTLAFEGAARMSEKPKDEKTKFWERKDIIGAQRVLDVWGTVKWHWKLGGMGIPTLDWIDMTDERFTIVEKRGKKWIEESKNKATVPDGKLTPAFLLVLGVDAVLGEFENPPGLHALLVHRYPADGPLMRTETERAYRRFRDKHISSLMGQLRGRFMEKKIDDLLGQMERDFLEHMAHLWLGR